MILRTRRTGPFTVAAQLNILLKWILWRYKNKFLLLLLLLLLLLPLICRSITSSALHWIVRVGPIGLPANSSRPVPLLTRRPYTVLALRSRSSLMHIIHFSRRPGKCCDAV